MTNEPLRFKNGKFKIMLIGDPHENNEMDDPKRIASAEDFYTLINTACLELEPDFVVYMGDNASADDEEGYRKVVERITYPLVAKGIPFGYIFGNHDHDIEPKIDIKTQLKIFSEIEGCMIYNADDNITGQGNCNLLVKGTNTDKDILNLWFIDSNNLYPDQSVSGYDIVYPDQIEWYKKTAGEIAEKNDGKPVPALLFQHMPVIEEFELLREAKCYEYFDSVPGVYQHDGKRFVLKNTVEGYLGEFPCPPWIQDGQFAAWKEIGDVKGAFFGHDHMNDFVGYVDGIMLGQVKLSGFRQYTDGCRGGVRLITIDENNPEDIDTRMYRFQKDFGLKSKSKTFYETHVSDRQDIKLKAAAYSLGAIAGITAVSVIASKIIKAIRK